MKKNLILAFIANWGIILQNIFHIHGWIFYLLFTAYILLVKEISDIFKLAATFLLGLLLSVAIWKLTGVLVNTTGALATAMPIASFLGILLVLSIRKFEILNMSAGFFLGLVAYYGVGRAPSVEVISTILLPALMGIVFAYLSVIIEVKFNKSEQ